MSGGRILAGGRPYKFTFYGFQTGLAGTATQEIDGTSDGAPSTAGIVEDPAGSGVYVCSITAPDTDGQYRLIFDPIVGKPAAEDFTVTADGEPIPDPPPGYTPSTDEVAAILNTRLRDRNGNSNGFTSDTTPTAAQVQSIIDSAAGKLAAKFGEPVTALMASAREVVKLRAAMLVELTYFGDQIQAGRSAYTEIKALYEESLADFILDRKQLGADGEAGTSDDLSADGLPAIAARTDRDWSEVSW